MRRSGDKGRVAAVSSIFLRYFFTPQEHTVYRNPDLYEDGVLSYLSRRANLARGVADAVEKNLSGDNKATLDIGAGTGIFSVELARRGLAVTALDLFAEPLDRLKMKAVENGMTSLLAITQADMNEVLPFGDDAFGVVTSLRATRYIRDFTKFLNEVIRVLEPGGVFVLPVFQIDAIAWRRNSRKGFRQETGSRGVRRAIVAAGFKIEIDSSKRYRHVVNKSLKERDVPAYYKPTLIVARKP
jgi:ubiquinone/menaquinone biosynthesis C-methylase UbiE